MDRIIGRRVPVHADTPSSDSKRAGAVPITGTAPYVIASENVLAEKRLKARRLHLGRFGTLVWVGGRRA